VSVVFGEHSNITNLGKAAFQECSALTRITLPGKLKIIEEAAFAECTSLELVICNKKLKTIRDATFQDRSMLEDVQLASISTSFGDTPLLGCDRLIEIAAAAGFPSIILWPRNDNDEQANIGAGVVPYLIARFERSERKRFVLLAHMRFKNAVHAHDGTEKEKVAAAQQHHPRPSSMPIASCSTCKAKRWETRKLFSCACNTWTYLLLQQKVPNRRLAEAQGRMQEGAQTQEARLQQG